MEEQEKTPRENMFRVAINPAKEAEKAANVTVETDGAQAAPTQAEETVPETKDENSGSDDENK